MHVERETRPSLERQPTERDRLLDSSSSSRERDRERERERERQIERNLELERERQIEMAQSRATTSDTYDTGLREQPSTLAQRDLIATVLDMKVDVRLEMQRMSQRIGRIEELLGDIVSRLGQDSSGQSSPGDAGGIPIVPTTTPSGTLAIPSSNVANIPGTSSGGNGLGPILLRKRRSKSRKAPAPPKQSPEQTRLLEAELPSTSSRKREFL